MGKKAKRIMAVLVSIFVLSGTASPVRADAAKQNIYRLHEYRHLCGCGWYAEDIAWYGVPKEGKTAGQTLLENGDFWEDEGTSGRLYIPSQGFSVALYACNSDGSNANGIIYPWDAAGDLSPYWGNIIADHFYQGFDVIKRCRPGDVCYIVNNGQAREYHMTLQDKNGINTGYHLQLSDGTNIEQSRDGIWMYTCNGYAKESGITITHWE